MCRCSGGRAERLDLRSQAALVTSGLVLVEDALVGDRVDDALGRLEQLGCFSLVARGDGLFDGLLHVLDDGAELRTQRRVGGVQLHVLAGALATRRDAYGLLLGFGGGGHGLGSFRGGKFSKDREYSICARRVAKRALEREWALSIIPAFLPGRRAAPRTR